jgi:hypothetical protein
MFVLLDVVGVRDGTWLGDCRTESLTNVSLHIFQPQSIADHSCKTAKQNVIHQNNIRDK